jgi:hypothetical protein
MTISGQTGDCATCHQGISSDIACAECHVSAGQPSIAEVHHTSQTAQTGLCSACHTDTAPADIICANCHGDTSNHHTQPEFDEGNCTFCHSTITLNGGTCSDCHGGGGVTIPEIHHTGPLTDVGGDCSVCHQAISDPSTCANCHSGSPHHSTTWSAQGDCAHCHSVPEWATDRPKQAACRECHGENMHDKGGPIQDFGACAACHTTIPFHPAPSRIPGYTGYGAGKKKFNIFWSRYAREEGPGEDISPNGEDMNDEGGRKIAAQTIPHNKTQISHNGQTYTVPYFDDLPSSGGGDTGGSGGNLDVCTSCHWDRSDRVACDYSRWTRHLSEGWVDLATYQLAESTYLGSLCSAGDSGDASDNSVSKDGTFIEAEHYNVRGDNFSTRTGSGSNDKYMRAEVDAGWGGPRGNPLEYRLSFSESGTYYLWVRTHDNDSRRSDSMYYGLNGSVVGDIQTARRDSWRWVNDRRDSGPDPIRVYIPSAGTHTINFWSREDGLNLDGFYLTKSNDYIPGGDWTTIPDGAKTINPTQ